MKFLQEVIVPSIILLSFLIIVTTKSEGQFESGKLDISNSMDAIVDVLI